MKKQLAAVAALSFVMVGCASVRVGPEQSIKIGEVTVAVAGLQGYNAAAVRKPDPTYVIVFVDSGLITVDQEPVRPPRPVEGTVSITWALDADTTVGYTFPDDNAIAYAGQGDRPPGLVCKVEPNQKKTITCAYKPSRPIKWKYAIRVVDRNGGPLETLDPWVVQP